MRIIWKKRLAVLLVFVLLLTSFSFAEVSSDLKNHWAQNTISDFLELGIVSYYDNGMFMPGAPVSRIEFMKVINKVYGLTTEKDIAFKDINSNSIHASVVKKAFAAGYIGGYPDGTLRPDQLITRAEASVILMKLEKLMANESAGMAFTDWKSGFKGSLGPIGAVVKAGIFKGYLNNTFGPTKAITRAEMVAAVSRLKAESNGLYGAAGTFGPATGSQVVNKNVLIKADKTTLQNMVIKGNLIIAASVGEGEVNLNNVTVEGETHIKGGGANSVKVNGGSYGKIFVMKAADTPVRLLVVNVKNVDVVVPQEAGGGQIILEGAFNSVSVLASKAKISTQGNTTINEIKFDSLALGVTLNIGGQTVVAKLIADVVLTVLGQGRIITAEVTVRGIVFEKQPETLNTTIGGTTTTTTTTGSGGSSGSSGSGGDSGSTATPITNFALASKTNSTATFTWSAATGASSVKIQQSPTGANTWTDSAHAALDATSTTGTVTGLSIATGYDFRLLVVGGTKAGTSNIITNVVLDSVPVADFALASKTTTSASFTWTAATGATSVKIQQSPTGANTWTDATHATLDAASTSGTVTGLNIATGYDFRLNVIGGSKAGTSNIITNVVTDSEPITDFALANKTTTSASFTWTAATGATSVKIQQSPTGANTWTDATHGALSATSTTGTAISLTPSTGYDFRLVVVGGQKAGTSNVLTNVVADAVIDFAFASKTTTSAAFTWSAATGATSVKIQQSLKGADSWTDATHDPLTASSTTGAAINLMPGTGYDFRLLIGGGTKAGTSNVVSNVVTDPVITDFAISVQTTTSAAFTWTAATGATSVKIQQSIAGSGNWIDATMPGTLDATSTTGAAINLTPGASYDFRLVVEGGSFAGISNTITNSLQPLVIAPNSFNLKVFVKVNKLAWMIN